MRRSNDGIVLQLHRRTQSTHHLAPTLDSRPAEVRRVPCVGRNENQSMGICDHRDLSIGERRHTSDLGRSAAFLRAPLGCLPVVRQDRQGRECEILHSSAPNHQNCTLRPGDASLVSPNTSSGSIWSTDRSTLSRKARYACSNVGCLAASHSNWLKPSNTATGIPRRVNCATLPVSTARTDAGKLRLPSMIECLFASGACLSPITIYIIAGPRALQQSGSS